jgi:ABC-2 type transport system ATP-binding protein
MSGKENIYLNGSILGMSKEEIDEKYDQIVAFADIGDFLEAPVATYSSGMTVRLGFSIVIHSNPEILLADEGLAVGDLAFALKCYRKISEYRREGGTIILVSHGMSLVRNTCQKVLWVDKGVTKMYGDTQEVCDAYESFMMNKDSTSNTEVGAIINNDPLTKVTKVEFLNKDDKTQAEYYTGELLKVRLHYSCKRRVEKPVFSVTFMTPENVTAICNFTILDGYKMDSIEGDGYIDFVIDNLSLKPSEYRVSLTFTENDDINNILEWHEKYYPIIINGKGIVTYGLTNPFPKWELHKDN